MVTLFRHRSFLNILRILRTFRVPHRNVLIPLSSCLTNTKDESIQVPIYPKRNSLQQHLTILRHELHAATNLAIICALFLLIIFVLGAQSSIQGANITETQFTAFPSWEKGRYLEPPIQRQLHERHSVPRRYLRLMSTEQQYEFLMLLSSPASHRKLALPSRRAVFALISACRVQSCLRAIASAVTYATVTGRVAVVFVKESARVKITEVLRLNPTGLLNKNAIVISLDEDVPCFQESKLNSELDWAEFSVIHATAPSSYSLNMTASTSLNGSELPLANPKISEDEVGSLEEHLPKIGNTKEAATLDNLAVVNSHVSVSLREVVWSSYSPRIEQEALFETEFIAASGPAQKLLERSSLLGRRQETRNIKATEARLYSEFKVPRMLLKGMKSLCKKLLLLKLESKMRRGNNSPRAMFVHAQYGLGNRLRALGSAMAFARQTDRVLVLIWIPDQHLNCRYTDLFVGNDEFVVSDSFDPGEDWPFLNNRAADKNMQNVRWYNFMRVNGKQVNSSNDPVADEKGYHLYVSTCYVIQSPVTPFIIRTTSSFWHVLRSLTPHIEVLRLVERFSSYPLSEMIGIHIRGKSIKTDISGITATDYTKESSRTTDFWRNLTQVDTFIAEMRRQTVDQLFYVAADSKDVFSRLEKEFPSRVYYTPRTCDSRERECLPFALADILLLAKCSSLRGSYWSSFSELSTRIGGARFLLAGIDFGRPDRQLF